MIVMENGLKSVDEYKTKYKELGLPAAPNCFYKSKGWIDWPSFFGKETIVFPSYEKAHEIVMVAGIGTSSSPADMAFEMREMVLWV